MLVRDRLRRQARVTDTDPSCIGLALDERTKRCIEKASAEAAPLHRLCFAGAHLGEMVTLLSEGLCAPIGIPVTMTSVGIEVVCSAVLHVDLACDLAAILGLHLDGRDAESIAGLVGALMPGAAAPISQFAKTLASDFVEGLVSVVGMSYGARRVYENTRRFGEALLGALTADRRAASAAQ